MPAETEKPCPKGFPTAITQSPTRARSLLPNFTKDKGLSYSTFNKAISVLGSVPTKVAFNSSPLKSSINISSACSITWLFVTTNPVSDMINPEPRADVLLLFGLPFNPF